MRNLLLTFVLLAAVSAQAADLITATLTITNTAGTTNGHSLTINSDTRYWTNAVYTPASQILYATNITQAQQRLLAHIAAHPFSSVGLKKSVSTNILVFQSSSAISIAASNGWATVSLSTNSTASGVSVVIPIEIETPEQRTNIASAIAAALNSSYNTNPISAGGSGATNLWAGPTNTFNLLSPSVYPALGDVSVTNIGRTDPAYTRSGSLFINNGSGSNITTYLDPWIVTTTGTNYVSCYSNNLTELAFESFGRSFTNVNVIRYGAIPPPYSSGYGSPYAYYSLEDINSAGLVDSVNGFNFSHYSGTNSPVSGVVTNGLNVKRGSNRRTSDDALDLSTNSFTVRFWYKAGNTNDFGDVMLDFANFYVGYGAFTWPSGIQARFNKETSGNWTISTTTLYDTAWHRVMLWYVPSNYVAIRLDQEAITTNAIDMRIYGDAAGTRDIPGLGTSYIQYIDELAIWTNYVPSAGDMLYDWNAGAGRGKP